MRISNSRLARLDEKGVTFRWKDYRRDRQALDRPDLTLGSVRSWRRPPVATGRFLFMGAPRSRVEDLFHLLAGVIKSAAPVLARKSVASKRPKRPSAAIRIR